MTQQTKRKLASFAIALLGVAVFRFLGLPLPWLLGPMFACLLAAFAGVRLAGAPRISTAMRTVLGVAVGASLTPSLVDQIGEMVLSIALIPPFILCIGLTGYPYFRRLWGFDPATSYYASMPGGLQDMLVFGEEAGGSPRVLSLVHATRILVIVTVLPLILSWALDVPLDRPPGEPAADIPALELVLMVVIAIAGWWGAKAVGLFGASILGPLILAAIASLTGVIHHRPPVEAILAAQFFIGATVGVKYVGITVGELRRVVLAALGYVAILSVLSAIFASIAYWAGFAPMTEAILAFSPGGQAEMAVLAIVAGADIAYVITHHLVRMVTVIVGAPIVQRSKSDP
ncbi:AbrB family transcriptional regulator [Tropicimonas marinistellae]|uniref:AbrB family transcriptional regulator n=1 Tax=Tropicimonas marinistellae TaxID=1739787 RepID=UPI000A5E7304|nr:AbrB family transcriptional regulator [Tropicimonas marinistellae]